MKIKHFILLAALSAVCAIGSACAKTSDEGTPDAPAAVQTTSITLNQSAVTFCVGETFTLTAAAENVQDASFVWAVDGDSATDVVSLTQTGNTATITALKIGETKLIASITVGENVYYKTVEVTVTESESVAIVLSQNVGFDNDGYHVRLSTLSTEAGDVTTITPIASVYQNNRLVPTAVIQWESANSDVVTINGNQFIAGIAGETTVTGSCTVDGKRYLVDVSVTVYKPTVELNEIFTVERENLSELTIESPIRGIVDGVYYGGARVGEFDEQIGRVTLQKSLLPTSAAEMGDGQAMVIETNLASYAFKVNLYTKILTTKADLDGFAAIAKAACPKDGALWDGYFVLGADVAYNGLYQSKLADLDSLWSVVEGNWSNGGLYGFRGVFDGKGYNISGMSIDNGSSLGSFIGVLHIDGIIKNVSFTEASVAANSSFVCGAGGGTVQNVYVEYASMGKGMQHYEGDGVTINNHCATFFGFKEPIATANVTDCVINVTNASFYKNVSIQIAGSEYVTKKNVFVVGGTEELREKSNATAAYESIDAFVTDDNAQARYQKFDEAFWEKTYNVPVPNSIFGVVSNLGVCFIEKLDTVAANTSYRLSVDNQYVSITVNGEKAAVSGGVLTLSNGASGSVTVTATSIFNPNKSDSFTCNVVSLNFDEAVDLTKEENAFYDLTEGKVYFAELGEKITDEVLYFVNPDGTVASYADEGYWKAVIAVTRTKLYRFHCESVTKVLSTAADLHSLRKDYTVYSYGNGGCYDGVITGSFVLVNDIDCTGLELKNSGSYWENSRGFRGTLDGRGYTISNLSVGVNGLFGAMAYATVKNINFTGVRLTGNDGAYVALFASRVFNSTVENVTVQFASYVTHTEVYKASGLLFCETSFDNTFKNVTLDVSAVSGVRYVTEYHYNADVPFGSKEKSTYENVTVIVANGSGAPAFAYKLENGVFVTEPYPNGIIVKDQSGNVL